MLDIIGGQNIATLTVLKFETADGAKKALHVIQDLSKKKLINLHDAAIVSWPEGKKKPKTEQMTGLTSPSLLSGAFWGFLFGLIFFVPIFGLVAGATLGALTSSMKDVGIDEEFIRFVRDKVTEGTSALFLMTSDVVLDKVEEATRELNFEIIATNLSEEEEQKLYEVFAEEKKAPAQ